MDRTNSSSSATCTDRNTQMAAVPLIRIRTAARRRCLRLASWCLAILLTLMVTSVVAAAVVVQETNDVNGLLDRLDLSGGSGGDVRKQWGLADTTATVGKLFRYHIPTDAFAGNVHHYEVIEASGSTLPKWLHFNAASSTLEGVPMSADVGQLYLVVRAFGNLDATGKSKSSHDVFSVDVLPSSRDASRSLLLKDADTEAPLPCDPSEDVTTMSILLDSDIGAMAAADRTQLIDRLVDGVGVSENRLRLLPYDYNDRILDGSTIMAGPGNARQKHSTGILVQWRVGCGRQVTDVHESLVNTIEKMARDGTLADAIHVPVVGWHLSVVRPQQDGLRRKRQAYYGTIPTPVPGIVPSRHPTYSETAFHDPYPENEQTDERVDEDEGPTPDVRIIPTMASPTFTMATTSHRHRHHHEIGTHHRGRQNFPFEEPSLTASPTFHYFHGTPVLSTPLPTPVLPAIHVTRPTFHSDLTDTSVQPSLVKFPDIVPTESTDTDGFTFRPTVTGFEIAPTKTSDVSTTTTTIVPGVTQKNFHPVIRNRIPKLVFIAGKISQFKIPESTFFDFEQGETPQLKLILLNADGTALNVNSWIQFNSERQEIYAIPLEENIGKWDFILEAMDNEGDSVKDFVEIHVRQHPSSRAVHHEFVLHMKYDKWRFESSIEWQIRLSKKLAEFFGDRDEKSIVVRSVTADPVVFTWTNDSLQPYPCPREKIMDLMQEMASREGTPTKYLRKILSPEFRVQKVIVNLLGHCKVKAQPTSPTHINYKPELRNQIDEITATVGEILSFKVPEDTFHDEEDGNARNLHLTFLAIDGAPMPRTSWIQFNRLQQEFIGLPMDEDVGRREYQLVATDKNGTTVADALEVVVSPRPRGRRPSVEFSVHIDTNFEDFNRDLFKKVMVLDKLAHLFGDPDPRYITVQSITRGSVVYAWSNNTLPYEPCPKEQVLQLVSVMFYDNGTVTQRMLDTFHPDFNITGANVMPLGVCLADITPTSISVGPTSTTETEHATSDDDIYITTVIPAVVITAMLLIAAIIACILYRKKRKGKMTMEDSSTFVNKGIPIIFADELDDKPDPAKSPVIMKEEKPPLPPPEYPRSSGSASPATPPTDRKRSGVGDQHHTPHSGDHGHHHHLRNDVDDLGLDQVENSPPYQPPPPFTANRDSRLSRPKHTPTYRLPPPYVPP